MSTDTTALMHELVLNDTVARDITMDVVKYMLSLGYTAPDDYQFWMFFNGKQPYTIFLFQDKEVAFNVALRYS